MPAGITQNALTDQILTLARTLFLLQCYCGHAYVHSFPTRRSSDLVRPPSSENPVELNAAPPCAIVVPDPLSRDRDSTRMNASHVAVVYVNIRVETNSVAAFPFNVFRPNVMELMINALLTLDGVPAR